MLNEEHTDYGPDDKAKMSPLQEAKRENSAATDRNVTNILFDVDFDVVTDHRAACSQTWFWVRNLLQLTKTVRVTYLIQISHKCWKDTFC